MPYSKIAIIWFRQDLRLKDNPALLHAIEAGYDILPLYILDDGNAGEWKMGGASRWWLHESLTKLNKSLDGAMVFQSGKAEEALPEIIKASGASAVFWNRCYEPWRTRRDQQIKLDLKNSGIEVESFNASLLWEPWEIKKQDGTPYKVFTPYYRKGCLGAKEPAAAQNVPKTISLAGFKSKGNLDDLGLLPSIHWYETMQSIWQPGESGAGARLSDFLDEGIKNYKEDRNRPDKEKVSRLSPHLHFGEISPRAAWHEARARGIQAGLESDMDCFCSELGWREFSYALLTHNPEMPSQPLQTKFKAFPWDKNDAALSAWQQGRTGIPIIDAGMRQLWQTGWMHNRIRMVVASFLIKNLRIHWVEGEKWFWDCLVDADLASNAASWQWVAGSGTDAAPYFRIFNPVTQGEKFDPNGDYVREFVPELKDMPDKYLHKPWEAPPLTLKAAGVELGKNYPHPLVDLKQSRVTALEAFKTL